MGSPTKISENATQTLTVAQAATRALVRAGIELVFSIPGGPLMPATEAMSAEPKLQQILARQEAGAAHMADGHYRATGGLAAVAVTAGPGTTNLITALALAFREHVPMLVIAAQVSTASHGLGAAQELDTLGLLQPITKKAVLLANPDRIGDTIVDLVRLAMTPRCGPVALVIPTDLFRRPVGEQTLRSFAARCRSPEAGACDADQVEALTRLLSEARRPFVLAGRGAVLANAGPELRALAERRPDLLIGSTPRAKGIFPEDHPQCAGVVGLGGHDFAERAALEQADLLVVLGTRLGEISTAGWDPRFRDRRIAQVDIEPTEPGRIFPVELAVAGDIRAVLRGVLERTAPPSGAIAPRARTGPLASEVRIERQSPIHPRAVMAAIDKAFPQNGHVFVDIGNSMTWATHYLERTQPGRFHVNLIYGSMGHGIPAAVGASFRAADPVLAIAGDAAFLMSCMELGTAAQERRKVTTVILDDGGHGMVEVGRQALFAHARIKPPWFDPQPDIAGIARSLGLRAFTVNDACALDAVLREALDDPGPALVSVRVDRAAWPPLGSRMKSLLEAYSGVSAVGLRNAEETK